MLENADKKHNARLTIHLIGPLRLIDGEGNDVTPNGRKACGLIALLALAPSYQRSKVWLQDKLWSDRAHKQGVDSLRQTLREIRQSLGNNKDCLIADRAILGLNPDLVEIVWSPKAGSLNPLSSDCDYILLEGIDIRDAKFEEWLRTERQKYDCELEKAAKSGSKESPQTPPTVSKQALQLVMLRSESQNNHHDAIFADKISDTIAKTVAEIGAVDVIDWRSVVESKNDKLGQCININTIAVQTDYSSDSSGSIYRVRLFDPFTNRMIWSTSIASTEKISEKISGTLSNPEILCTLNTASAVALRELNQCDNPDRQSAQKLCFDGIESLYKLGNENFDRADKLFAEAFEIDHRGIYLAWQAYLRTFLIAERKCSNEREIVEEALDYMRRAIEMDPHNSFVLSLSAHVHAITQNSFVAAYWLAKRSLEINMANPLGWISLAVAESQIGNPRTAFEYAKTARQIAGTSPFRYHIEALCCIVGVLSGDIEEARYFGETSHAMAPRFAVPLRFLSAIYLHDKRPELAENMISKLTKLEPDFTIDLLREPTYPSESIRKSILIDSIPAQKFI